MKLLHLHIHFEANGVELWSLDSEKDYKHCIYCDRNSKKVVTIPKMDGDEQVIKSEIIVEACNHFGIPIPEMVMSKF